MRSETFYYNRLAKYFDTHYQEYAKIVEWYTNPAPNQWKFEIPGVSMVALTCFDDGKIVVTTSDLGAKSNEQR